jgi:hypothetical protein
MWSLSPCSLIYIEQPNSEQPIATIFVGNRDHHQMIALAEFICIAANTYAEQ